MCPRRHRIHRGQPAHAAAAQQRQQHGLELVFLVMRGQQQLVGASCAASAL
jgi:hypothetical protein